jgi:lysophospholipase L1-like esterase
MLTGAGLPAADNNLIGLGVSTLENARDNDPRFSIGSGGFFATHPTAGAQLLMLTTATTPSVFTPGGTNAGFKVWYSTNGGNGTFSVAVNGGAATNVNTNFGSVALASQTFSASQGANTISLNWVSGGPCYVVAIEAIDPSTGVVHIMNAGWSGSRVTDWNDSSFPWSPLLMIAALTPDVTFIDLGINDWVNSESVATYTTGLQAIISAAKAVGDCVVVTPAPSAITRTTAATQAQYTAAARTLALSNGCVIIDGSARWGSYEITNPLGLYANTLHPNGTGYAEWAKPYFSLLMNE